jgi:hypothetical protein
MAFSGNPKVTKADDSSQEQSNIQMSITEEKLAKIKQSANETTKALNEVFNAVSGKGNFAKTFDDLADGIKTAASALDNLQSKVNSQDKILNNVASVQAQFDGLQSAYANINSKLNDLVKSTDASAINDVDKIIHNIEKMEQSTADVSKSLKKSLQKMAEDSGNVAEIDSTIKTIENNFLNVSDEIKSKFNELIERQIQDIISGIQSGADASLAMISNGRGLQKKFNQSITNTGNNAAGVYQNAVVAQQMNNAMPFWNRSDANFNGIANTASEMGVMQTKYEHASSRVRDSYTAAEKEDDPEKRKQLIKEANEQYQNLVAIQKAMNAKAKELGKQLNLVSPDDLKRLGQEGKDLAKHVKNILKETSANSGRVISLGVAFDVKDNEETAKSFAKDKSEIDNLNKALDTTNQKTASFAQTAKNELKDAFNTLKKPFNAISKYLPLLGAGGMFGLMNNITKPLQYYSEKHKNMYTSMGTDAGAGVTDMGMSQANADARLMRGNLLYMASGGMIDRNAINNSYNSAMKEVGGAYGASPEQGAAGMNSLVNKTALMQNVMGIDQGTMNNAYQTFYKDMRMNADEAADAIAECVQTAQSAGVPVSKYLNMIAGLAQDFMKIGIAGDKAETIMSNLLGKGMRADVAKEVASQTANSMGSFSQNYNMVGYAAAMQGMDPFHGLALASYSHEANGEVRKGWGSDMSKMMDTMLGQYTMAYGDNPDVKRFGVTDTLKKQFGFSQRTASTLASSYLQGDTKQFEEMFEKAMDKKENPNGALEEVNKQLAGQLGQMTGQLAGSDRLHAEMDGKLYASADTLGKSMDDIITKLGPLLIQLQADLLYAAQEVLEFADKFLNSKIWDKFIGPAIDSALTHPAAALATGMGAIGLNKLFKSLHLPGAGAAGAGAAKGGSTILKGLIGPLSGLLKGTGRVAAVGALAYGGYKLLTSDSGEGLGQTIGDFFTKGNVFDKIYDLISKIYNFITGGSSKSDDKKDTNDKSSILDKLKNLYDGQNSQSGLAGMGMAGLLGGAASRHYSGGSHGGGSSSSSGGSSSGLSSSATETLDNIANNTSETKKGAKEAGDANSNTAKKNGDNAKSEGSSASSVSKQADSNKKEQNKAAKKATAGDANATKGMKDAASKNHKSRTKMLGKLGGMAGKAKNSLSKLIRGGLLSTRGKFGSLGSGAKKLFGSLGKFLKPLTDGIGGIAKKLGVGGLALGALSGGIDHLIKGDAVEGDGVNSVVNNALPTLLGGAGMAIGSAAGPLGALALGAVGGMAGDALNNTETAKWAKNKILGFFGDTDEDQDKKRREQKPWAYNDNGDYDPYKENGKEDDDKEDTADGTNGNIEKQINDLDKDNDNNNSDIDKEAQQANEDLKKATGSSDSDMKMVDSGNDSGEEEKQRKADDSRMKASKDNSDKVVGQAKKEEKLSTTRNKQLQMFQNLHKQLMQMFQSSVKEEHGNLWKKLDIMEHILFDINKNIISTGKIMNKGLVNRGGGPGGGDAAANKKLFYQKLKAAGYSDAQSAGIMANIEQESGFNAESGKGGAHQGLVQWDATRWARLVAYAHSVNQSEWNPGIQMDFAIQEAQGRGLTPDKIGADAQAACANWNETEENSGEAPEKYRYGKIPGIEADIAAGKFNGTPPPASDPVAAAKAAAAAVGTTAPDTTTKPPQTDNPNTNPTTPPAGSGGQVMQVTWNGDGKDISSYNAGQQMANSSSDIIAGLDTSNYNASDTSSQNNNQSGNNQSGNNQSGGGQSGNGANNTKLQDGISANGTITKNGKIVDRFTPETRKKIEANLAKGVGPNGTPYRQNDIDYLKAHGYTDMEEIKIALNQDKRYAMEADNPEYLNLLKSGGVSSEDLSKLLHSNISMQSPFANNVKFVNSAHGVDAYWSDATTYLPDKSILNKVANSGTDWSNKYKAHYYGTDALMAGLYSGRFEHSTPSKSEKASASGTANKDTNSNQAATNTEAKPAGTEDAEKVAAATAEAAKAAEAAKTNTGATIDNGTGRPVTAASGDGSTVNSGIGAAMTKAVTEAADAGDQDKSDVQKGTAESKKDKIIDVNINIEAAEEHFMKMFGNSLKSAIESTGLKVTSLEQHTTEIAKQVTTAEMTIMDLMGAQRAKQK